MTDHAVKVLLVDDEQNVLSGYKRQLRKAFDFETALSGAEGLEAIARQGPFAVVVSDMRMPEMTGVEFLARVRSHSPDTVRIMLTGNADMQTCIDAVNEGSIFRFLTKPCPPELLAAAITAGIEQYRLVLAERELLQGTLRGTIRTLTDVLSLLSPSAFGRASRIRRYVRHIAAQLNCKHFWEYETAAALSQIGFITIPADIIARIKAGRPLSIEQRSIVANHPDYACQMLAEIPRLEMVAQVIAKQNVTPRHSEIPDEDDPEGAVAFGGMLLRVALDLDKHVQSERTYIAALAKLHADYGPDHPMIEALMSFANDEDDRVTMEIAAGELSTGMFAAEDIVSTSGNVVVAKGQHITEPIRMHLQACSQAKGLKEPFSVEVAAQSREGVV